MNTYLIPYILKYVGNTGVLFPNPILMLSILNSLCYAIATPSMPAMPPMTYILLLPGGLYVLHNKLTPPPPETSLHS